MTEIRHIKKSLRVEYNMLVKFKIPKNCDDCDILVLPECKDNSLYKTKDGAIVCEKCFLEQEQEQDE